MELTDKVNTIYGEISNDLTPIVNFAIRITDCESHIPAVRFTFLLILVFALQRFSLHWEILIMLLRQFQLMSKFEGNASFHCIAYYYSADWNGLCDPLTDIPWQSIFKGDVSAAASEF